MYRYYIDAYFPFLLLFLHEIEREKEDGDK